jgi:ribosomal protein S18
MENELKARITADISGFTSGMKRVEANLERANAIFVKSSKSVFQIENALAKLSKQYKQGAITEAEFTKRSEQLSRSLIEQRDNMAAASREVDRLKKTLSAQTIKPATVEIENLGNKVKNTANNLGSANTVALEFNRIIQDAPFGIIGVGNNIQQLASNFSNLSSKSTSTGAAVKAAFSALVTGPNLALLAISALTSAFTAYQMGLFGSKTKVDELKEAQDDLNKSLNETAELAKAGFYSDFLKELGLLQDVVTDTGRALSNVPTNLPLNEQLLKIANAIKTATKPELEALESFLNRRYQDSIRLSANATSDFEKQLADTSANEYKKQLELVNSQLEFYSNSTKKAEDATKQFKSALSTIFAETDFITQGELIGDAISKGIITKADGDKIKALMAASFAASDSQALQDAIATSFQTDFEKALKRLDTEKFGPKIKDVGIKLTGAPIDESGEAFASLKANLDEIDSKSRQVQESFSVLGSVISTVFKDNPGLGQFVSSLAKFAGEIIARNFAIAKSNAIAGASAAGAAAGPAAPFVTPGLIAAAIALVATAFSGLSKSGGGASGGGGSSQTFGNTGKREFGGPVTKGQAYIVGEKRPELFVPNTNGVIIPQLPKVGGTSTGGGGTMKIEVEVKGRIDGESIRLSNKRANTRVRNT